MSDTLGPWADARLTASWRGVAFLVRESELRFGRRQAMHEYPFRDTVWVEDLGQATRIVAFRGFLVGDDVDDQLQGMLAAAEAPGNGTLVHPTLGTLTASLLEPIVARDAMEQGRVWSLEFVFVAGAERVYPNAADDTQDAVGAAADDATAAVAGSFASVGTTLQTVVSTVSAGITDAQQVIEGVQSTVSDFVDTVSELAADVGTVSSLAGLNGNYGRFSLGARLAAIPGLTNATVALENANAAAAAVGRLGDTVNALAAEL